MSARSLVLTLNAGSSSLKFGVYEATHGLPLLATGQIGGLGTRALLAVTGTSETCTAAGAASVSLTQDLGNADHDEAVHAVLGWLEETHAGAFVSAASHRVVHGGPDHVSPALIDDALIVDLERFVPLAPLHQPHNLAGVRAACKAFPGATQVACFDTAFHRSHPFVADTFALPRRYYDEGIRRYGFHGLSYEFIARRLRAFDPVLAHGRVIVAHLGNGASMCAMRDGRSVASTMGFTALDGLPMGTRSGQLDPGVVLYLMQQKGMDAAAISDLLYQDAGLKGLSGLSHDVRTLLASDSDAARDALAYFADRARREIGGLAACLGGLDALVFTGGIGENAAPVRAAMLADTAWMGIQLDPDANLRHETVISRAGAGVQVLVFKTDEERMLAEHAAELLAL